MNAKHLEILAETLAVLKPLHTRIAAVGDEMQHAYDDQSGEWRGSNEGDAAGEEIGTIEEIASGLEDATKELRKFVFLLSENPDFAEVMSKGPWPKTPGRKIAPLPDKPPDPAAVRAKPRRPGAPPYPFLKQPDRANED